MKTILYTTLAIGGLWLSGCTGSRMASNSEVDDVYATSADYKADAEVYSTVDDAQTARTNGNNASTSPADEYDQGYASKNADRRGEYVEDQDPYGEDDYHYSRRLRRFNTRGYSYYDPYFAYDPYYAIGTPTWGAAYSNTPWWYDPYYYNGPSYSWTYNWGAPGNAFYSSYYSFNRPWWDRGWAGYGNNGWGNPGGYNSFGYSSYYGGGYGGFGGNYWSGGYNPCAPGFGYGGGGGFAGGGFGGGGWGGSTGGTTTTSYGPRNNMSSLNTNNTSGNNPRPAKYENPRSVRPYQGNYPLNSSATSINASGNPSTVRPTGTPLNNSGNIGATPRTNTNTGRPVRGTAEPSTYSTPRNSNSYTRPATATPRNVTPSRSTTPRNVTPSRSTTPRNVTPSRNATPRNVTPSRNATPRSAPSRNYNRPSRSSGSSSPSRSVTPSRSSSSSSGRSSSVGRSSGSSSSGSRSSSGGGRRR